MSAKESSGHSAPSLFPENSAPAATAQVQKSHAPEGWIIANVDGGARGNPGPAGFGVYIRDAKGRPIAQLSEYLGHRTNNFAEYSALLAALEYAIQHRHTSLKVISDSELMVRQMTGRYKVNSIDLKPLYEKAQSLVRKLDAFAIEHALREKNHHADRLANEAMDRGMGKKKSF